MPAYTTIITPRLYETDALGHINNATLAAWFEVARVRFLEALGSEGDVSEALWMLASVHIDFVDETFYGSDVAASIVSAEPGNSSLRLGCEMVQGGRLTVKGSAVMVRLDAETRKPKRLADSFRQALVTRLADG
ncbi:MAG: thioesterase family protein [Pseudomonadota bacterium]